MNRCKFILEPVTWATTGVRTAAEGRRGDPNARHRRGGSDGRNGEGARRREGFLESSRSCAVGATSTIHKQAVKKKGQTKTQPSKVRRRAEPQTRMPQPFPAGALLLVPRGPALRLREAPLPLARCPAALGPGLALREGAIAASAAFVLKQTAGQPGLGAEEAPSVWAPRGRRRRLVAVRWNPLAIAVCLLKGTAVVQEGSGSTRGGHVS